jgi:hypothetical protein
MELTSDEIRLLEELERGERTISRNRPRTGLARVISLKYVVETSDATSLDTTHYNITPLGRAALAATKDKRGDK